MIRFHEYISAHAERYAPLCLRTMCWRQKHVSDLRFAVGGFTVALCLLSAPSTAQINPLDAIPKLSQQVDVKTHLVKSDPFVTAQSILGAQSMVAETILGADIGTGTLNRSLKQALVKSQISAKSSHPTLHHRNRKISAVQAQTLIKTFTKLYGMPTSQRGNNTVWEIDNTTSSTAEPSKAYAHLLAKKTTIIIHTSLSGASHLTIDRERGEDGTASWAVPRRTKSRRHHGQRLKPVIKNKFGIKRQFPLGLEQAQKLNQKQFAGQASNATAQAVSASPLASHALTAPSTNDNRVIETSLD